MRVSVVKVFDRTYHGADLGHESSDELAPIIPEDSLAQFESRLSKYKYELSKKRDGKTEYKFTGSSAWSLKVEITKRVVCFTAPRTKSFNSNLVFECLQTASELSDQGNLAVFYCKDSSWKL